MLKQKTLPLTFAMLALAAALAGCGSSTAPGIVLAPSNGATADSATAVASTTPTTATTTTASVPTPTSGPLSTEPKVAIPSGPAPKTLQIKDLIKGTGPAAKSGGSRHRQLRGRALQERQAVRRIVEASSDVHDESRFRSAG